MATTTAITAAERGVLGCVLNRNDAIWELGNLRPEDFSDEGNAEIFRLLKDMIEGGNRSVTAALLLPEAQDRVIWGEKKASEYLRMLEDDAPPANLAAEMARAVMDASLKGRLETSLHGLYERVRASPVSISGGELREEVEREITALFSSVSDLGLRHMPAVADGILERLKNTDAPIGLPIGLTAVQDLIGTLQPGRLYMIGGGPGSGKSAMIAQIARNIARAGGVSVIYSPEMGAEEVSERMLSSDTGIKAERIERSLINMSEYEELFNANERTRQDQIFIDPGSKPSVSLIRGRSTRKKKMGGLDVVFIDHCHYLSRPDKRQAEFDALNENLEGLKAMAKDLGIPVVAACQLGTEALRDMAKWPHRKPHKGDLLFSGIVDRNADVIALLHRQEPFLRQNEPPKDAQYRADWETRCLAAEGAAEIILAKRRGGLGFGSRSFYFDASRTLFMDNDPRPRRPADQDLLTAAGF